MAYRIDPSRSPAAELRRIALDELGAAPTNLSDPAAEGLDRSVHAVRKTCKRLRSLARLVRPSLSPEEFGGSQASDAVLIIERVQHQLIRRCQPLGARVYVEDQSAYRQRLRRNEKAFRVYGRERRVGEIGAILAGDGGDRDH